MLANHSTNMYPDVRHATVKTNDGESPVLSLIDEEYVSKTLIPSVQERGEDVLSASFSKH